MKQKPNNYLKLITLLLGLLLNIFSCQKESLDYSKETIQENRFKRITLKELKSRIGNSHQYSKLSRMFDVNKPKLLTSQQRLEASSNPYLLTDEIVMIEKGSFTYYTFTIESNNLDNEFYNLVAAVDETNTIISIRILEYQPNTNWLTDTSQPFSGSIQLIQNNFFQESDIIDALSSRGSIGDCVVGLDYEWVCNAGYNHAPNTCNAGGSEIIISPVYGPCPDTIDGEESSNGGGFPVDLGDSSDGGGGSTGTSNEDDGTSNSPEDNEDCIVDNNGDCITDETTPLPKRKPINSDCKKLKLDITDVPLIKTRLNTMLTDSVSDELGLRVDIDQSTGAYTPTSILNSNNGEAHINIPVNPFTVVVVHTHPDSNNGFYTMFSGPDIIKMGEIIKYVQSGLNPVVNPVEITHILIADGKTFALRFDDAASVQTLLDIYEDINEQIDFIKKLKKDYKSDNSGFPLYQSTTTIDMQQQHLYNLFSEYNLNMSLYEANYDANGFITDWQKINKENLEKEPCN